MFQTSEISLSLPNSFLFQIPLARKIVRLLQTFLIVSKTLVLPGSKYAGHLQSMNANENNCFGELK